MSPAPAAGTPRLQLLRDPQLIHADGRSSPPNDNDAALLALLAFDGPTSREQVVAWFWPEVDDPARARNALRQRLFRLRRGAGLELVGIDEVLSLAPGLAHDLQHIEAALEQDPAVAAQGDLLGGLEYPQLEAFSAWLAAARERWRRRRSDALAMLASRLEAEDRIAAALLCAQRLVQEDPLAEHAQRRLMRLHYRRGDRAAALAVHAGLVRTLAAELGAPPSAETAALARLIAGSGELPVATPPLGPSLLRPPRLVGRGALWQGIAAAREAGRTVLLVGEPGIGKSRLAGDFAAAHGLPFSGGRPGDARVPFSLLARLLRLLGLGRPGAPALEEGLRAELARLLPELGAAPAGRADEARLQAALARLLAQAAPAGAVLDDLQFADEATLEMLPGLCAAAGGWLLCVRSQALPAAIQAWLDADAADTLARFELLPLSEAQVAELLATLALPGLEVAAWAPRVHRRGGGNPLFVLETLRAVIGARPAADGPPADPADWSLPDTLRRLIERRLQQLSPQALKLAQVAAVAGQDFAVDLAAAVLAVHALDLFDAWRELESAQVMQGERFAHDLIFEAVRDAVPVALRRWLHARVAEWMQGRQLAPARQGQHWREAGEPARAAPCFEQSASAAAAAGRLAEQVRWLDAAVDAWGLAGQRAQRFDAMLRRVVAAREALSPLASMQLAEQLLAEAGDDRERALALLQRGSGQLNAVQFEPALATLDQASALALQAGDEDTAQHARYRSALALAQIEGYAAALQRLEPLLRWAEAQPDESLRHCFLADLAILYDQADQRCRARPYFERSLAYFDRQRETGNAAPTRMMFARSLLMLGDMQAARALLESAVRERAELSEGEGGDGIEVLNLGRVYCELGAYGQALGLLEPSLARLAERGHVAVQAATALVLARIWIHLGQTARAMNLINGLPQEIPFHQRASLLWTRSLWAPERARERALLLDEALALFGSHADLPFLRLPMLFDRLACEPGEAALQGLRAAIAECERRELRAPQMLGRLRLLQVLTALERRQDALTIAANLQQDLPGCHPVACYLPEIHLACSLAAAAAGDTALAQASQSAALRWLAAVSQTQLAPAFRDSFAHRNPVNRSILTASLR